MCSNCDEIDLVIARYQRLMNQVHDHQAHVAAKLLVAELELKKAALHPE